MALKPLVGIEGSLTLGAATIGLVYGIYQLDCGSVASVQATPVGGNESRSLSASRKKAGWTSLVVVAGISLLARDPHIVMLGGATIIAMEAHYRHAIMADHETGQLVAPPASAYQPAENVVPIAQQGTSVSYG
jgi:hypothetical protein